MGAADGTVLREMQIDSSLITYYVQNQRMIVPRPGRLLVRDHRPPDQKEHADASEEDGLSTQRGASAFQWSKYLDYNGSDKTAIMKGDVQVAYKPDAPKELPVRLRADEVIATLENAPQSDNARPGEAVPAAGDMKAPLRTNARDAAPSRATSVNVGSAVPKFLSSNFDKCPAFFVRFDEVAADAPLNPNLGQPRRSLGEASLPNLLGWTVAIRFPPQDNVQRDTRALEKASRHGARSLQQCRNFRPTNSTSTLRVLIRFDNATAHAPPCCSDAPP